jgi:hypothetical protein
MTVEVERREEARAESEGATAGARARVKAIFRRKERAIERIGSGKTVCKEPRNVFLSF